MAEEPTADPDVVNQPEARRYEIRVEGQRAGFAAYDLADDRLVFTHTEIDEKFERRGLGGRLAKAALDDVRQKGNAVVPQCPFIAAYIEHHPEYGDLVEGGRPTR